MAYWIVKKYNEETRDMVYVSEVDEDNQPILTTEKANAFKFDNLKIPVILCLEQNYNIEKRN